MDQVLVLLDLALPLLWICGQLHTDAAMEQVLLEPHTEHGQAFLPRILGEAMVLQDLQDLGQLLVDWQFAIHDAGDLINHMAWNCHAFEKCTECASASAYLCVHAMQMHLVYSRADWHEVCTCHVHELKWQSITLGSVNLFNMDNANCPANGPKAHRCRGNGGCNDFFSACLPCVGM